MLPNPQVSLARTMGVRFFVFVLMSAAVVFPTIAQTIDAASVGQRISQMERRLMAVENARFSGPSTSGGAVADMELRVQDLENEIGGLNGAVERLSKVVQSLAEKMDAQQKDLELRLQDLEKSGVPVATPAAGHGPVSGTVKKTDPAQAEVKGEAVPDGLAAQELYNKGYGYLTAADYPKAKAWMQALIAKHPKDNLSDNAHYWLGEIALVQGDAAAAAVAFKDGLTAFPKGQKAPANLLKLGVALEKLGKNDLAKGMWDKLLKDHPKAPESIKAKEYLAKLPKAPDAAPVAKKG